MGESRSIVALNLNVLIPTASSIPKGNSYTGEALAASSFSSSTSQGLRMKEVGKKDIVLMCDPFRLNVNQPLFAGCYFGLESGSQRWIQFKYEKMGIFCYNCGVMGHQRRGCSLSSPITVASVSGVPFPMYGPWMSLESTYLDIFSGAFTFTPASTPVDLANPVSASPGSQPLAVTIGSKGHGRRRIARLSNQSMKVTDRRDLERGQTCRKVWVPKEVSASRTPKYVGSQDGGKEVVQLPGFNSKLKNRELTIGKRKGPRFGCSKGKEAIGPAKSNSIESSICGQEVNFYHDEQLALTNFFQAQGTTLQELKKFGNLDLYEIKSIGGDIGVPTTSEVNERTTPFKKRKFDETTASLCSRPWKLLRPQPWAIRDFPWDTKDRANDTMESKEEPSEEVSLSNNVFTGPDEWKTKGKNVISSRPMEGTFVIEDSEKLHGYGYVILIGNEQRKNKENK
ncbi:hypothetical protein G4B88_020137 [Cannabis sativa]|uniref:CCHC-type domain-containing protein n=1 Tax=Cannabis sativa TaxID=3483 RepID=A0A7J6EL48_CANSA|nr:hypothetical protein G4B88_020137 [Cannabis sativa]